MAYGIWHMAQLSDWTLERAGRVKAPKLTQNESCSVEYTQREGKANLSRSESFILDCEGTQSAALVIIGDEILNGFTTEVNLQVTY
jgi:hypothetical protein